MKKQQQTVSLPKRDLLTWMAAVIVGLAMAFGYGYFWGRHEQIQLNRSVLKTIPDVNCSQEAH